jgi:hypothetical protein
MHLAVLTTAGSACAETLSTFVLRTYLRTMLIHGYRASAPVIWRHEKSVPNRPTLLLLLEISGMTSLIIGRSVHAIRASG